MTHRKDEPNDSVQDSKAPAAPQAISGKGQALRREAELKVTILDAQNPASLLSKEAERLLHELRVHQIELELQNEELRRIQTALEISRSRYFDLYDLAPVGYVTLNEEGLILEANLRVATLLGITRNALVAQPLARFILSEDQDIYYRHRKILFETGAPQVCELRLTAPEGAQLWVRVEAAPARDQETAAPLCRAVISDITAQRQAEAEKKELQERLGMVRRIESVGRLAGGVAHEFNNMLAVILGYTENVRDRLGDDHPLQSDLKAIHNAAERSADLVRQLLAFAGNQAVSPKVLNLNIAVANMLKMLNRLVLEEIDLSFEPGDPLWSVNIDPVQFDQMLTHLVVNARDAIAGIGRITIGTTNTVLDNAFCADHPGSIPGEYVQLTLSDTGAGMSRETLAHIFEPFFTTKEMRRSAGLGLATVYGIVTQNSGCVDVTSALGRGTTFNIYLPRYDGQTATAGMETQGERALQGTETVLIVEDEETILRLCQMILEGLGYTVLAADTPDRAIHLAEGHPGPIHLLMTDVVMPGMHGRELAMRLSSRKPDMKCLFMSGYTADIIADRGVLPAGVRFIQKPFVRKELARKVREALDQ